MSWSIVEIKSRARVALRDNYWKTVFVSVLMLFLTYGTSVAIARSGIGEVPETIVSVLKKEYVQPDNVDVKVLAVLLLLSTGMILLGQLVKALLAIFIKNPLQVGAVKFMLKTSTARQYEFRHQGMISELAYAFDCEYINMVKVMFMKDVLCILWLFVFVVPGIIKSYQYRLVPYILCEHREYTPKEALSLSRKMMVGHKWHSFLMDMSFAGWHVLGILTLGVVELFFATPYYYVTDANFYRAVRADYVKRMEIEEANKVENQKEVENKTEAE